MSALKYSTMVDVYITYEVITDSGFDETQPPDIDTAVYDDQFHSVAGFTADSELVPCCAAHALMGSRKIKPKRQQTFGSRTKLSDCGILVERRHKLLFSAIQVQPALITNLY